MFVILGVEEFDSRRIAHFQYFQPIHVRSGMEPEAPLVALNPLDILLNMHRKQNKNSNLTINDYDGYHALRVLEVAAAKKNLSSDAGI